MRLSIDKNDRGWRPNAELVQYDVFFNGVKRIDVHTADEEQGFIRTVTHRRPAPWLPVISKASMPFKGKVEIKHK